MRRLKAEHTNNSGAIFKIYIYDREAETNVDTEFDCKPEFFRLKMEGDQNDPFKRIIPSHVQFTILTGVSDYNETQIEDIQSFYDDLVNGYEGRFYVLVIMGEGIGFTRNIFYGKILPDVGDMVLGDIGDFTITAIDGITDLKNKEYRPTDYSDLTAADAIQTYSFKDHFISILTRNDVVEFFNETLSLGNSVFLTTAGNWTESYSVAGDIWKQVRVRNFYFEQKTSSYRKYKSCYDVLVDLLTGMNARLICTDGLYHVEQLGYMDNPAPEIYGYTITGAAMAGTYYDDKVQHNYNTNDDLQAAPGISVRRLAPFKAVELQQSKQFTNFMNGMDISVNGNNGPHNYGYVIGAGNKLVLQWHGEIILGSAWSAAPYLSVINVEWILTFKVSIGDYWLKADNPLYGDEIVDVGPAGTYHYGPGGTVPVLSWSLTESTITIRWERSFASTSLADFNSQVSAYREYIRNSALVIESNDIQADGEMVFEFLDFVTKRNGTTIGGFPPGLIQLKKTSRIIIASGYNDLYEQPEGIKRYEVGDARNSLVYPVSLGYYDSPERAAPSQLFMTIVGNPLFSEYPTTEWTDPDSGDTLPIQELMMKQILAMRALPTNTFKIQFYYRDDAHISMRDIIVMNDLLHIPLDMEMVAGGPGGYTTYNTVMWEVYKDYIGINVVDTGDPEVQGPGYPLPDGSLDSAAPGNNTTGIKYWEEWEDVSTAYVEPTAFVFTYDINTDDPDDIKKRYLLVINGVKQRYTDGTVINRTWKFDLDFNRLTIFKGAGNIAHVELFIYY